MEHLEFENGTLVKWRGQRPEHMDGHALLALVRLLGKEVHGLREKHTAEAQRAAAHGEMEICFEFEGLDSVSARKAAEAVMTGQIPHVKVEI